MIASSSNLFRLFPNNKFTPHTTKYIPILDAIIGRRTWSKSLRLNPITMSDR